MCVYMMYSVCMLYVCVLCICGDVYVVCMCELLLAHWLTQTFDMFSALLGLALRQLFGSLLLCRDLPHCSEFRAQFAHRHLLVFIIGSQPLPGITAASNLLFGVWGDFHKLVSLKLRILHSLRQDGSNSCKAVVGCTQPRSPGYCLCAFPRHQRSYCQPLTKLLCPSGTEKSQETDAKEGWIQPEK